MRDTSDLLQTCQSDYDDDSKDVWIFRQDSWGLHGHMLSAKFSNVISNEVIKGCTPRPGHT